MCADAELLRCYAEENSEAALAAFVERNIALVHSAALRRTGGDAHTAADVTQRVFLSAARHAKSLAHHPRLSGWLYTATRNAALNLMRDEQRRQRREHAVQIMNDLAGPADAAPQWEELRPVLDAAMDELGEKDREAVLLRFFEQQPFTQVGRRLQLTENAARMRVERALEKLRALLERRGITSTGAALGTILAAQANAAVPAGLATAVTTTAFTGAASAGAGTAVAVFSFMSTTKVIVGIAVILAIGGVGSAIYQKTEKRNSTLTVAAIREERDWLRAQVTALEERAREAEQRAQVMETRGAVVPPSTGAAADGRGASRGTAPQSGPTPAASGPGQPSASDLLSGDPEYQQAALKRTRVHTALTYGAFYRKLGLSPEQITAFEDAMVEAQQTAFDITAAAAAQGLASSDPAIGAMRKPGDAAFGQKIRAALGDGGVREYAAYIKTLNARTTVDELAGKLYYTDSPLTFPQADRLTATIAANTTSPKWVGLYPPPKETNWDAVMMQMQGTLTPPQLNTLQALKDRARLDREMADLAASLQKSAGTAASGNAASAGAPAAKPPGR